MTLTQNGIDYICQNFGDTSLCCTNTGLSWFYTSEGADYNESGGTAQIVSRLASGLISSLTMTDPARGIFTQAELNAANGSPVTIQDAQQIAQHDEPAEGQWCYGAIPPGPIPWPVPWPIIGGVAVIAAVVVGAIVLKKKRKRR